MQCCNSRPMPLARPAGPRVTAFHLLSTHVPGSKPKMRYFRRSVLPSQEHSLWVMQTCATVQLARVRGTATPAPANCPLPMLIALLRTILERASRYALVALHCLATYVHGHCLVLVGPPSTPWPRPAPTCPDLLCTCAVIPHAADGNGSSLVLTASQQLSLAQVGPLWNASHVPCRSFHPGCSSKAPLSPSLDYA